MVARERLFVKAVAPAAKEITRCRNGARADSYIESLNKDFFKHKVLVFRKINDYNWGKVQERRDKWEITIWQLTSALPAEDTF